MTDHLIYGKAVRVQADSFSIEAPTAVNALNVHQATIDQLQSDQITVTQSITFPTSAPTLTNPLTITRAYGGVALQNPPIAGPTITVPASVIMILLTSGSDNNGHDVAEGVIYPLNLLDVGTVAVGGSIIFPGWITPPYRPLEDRRVPVFGAVGPAAQPTTLIFKISPNGDVTIYKDTIGTPWNVADTFTLSGVFTPFKLLIN